MHPAWHPSGLSEVESLPARLTLTALSAIAVSGCGGAPSSKQSPAATLPPVRSLTTILNSVGPSDLPRGIAAQMWLRIDRDILMRTKAGQVFRFNLPDGPVVVVTDHVGDVNALGHLSWRGHLLNSAGYFVAEEVNGFISGAASVEGRGHYEIRSRPDGSIIVSQVPLLVTPNCAWRIAVADRQDERGSRCASTPEDDGRLSIVDVTVMFTRPAACGHVMCTSDDFNIGKEKLRQDVRSWFQQSNHFLACSKVAIQLRMVGFDALETEEMQDMEGFRRKLVDPSSQPGGQVLLARNDHGADIVSVIVSSGNNAGIGSLLKDPVEGFADQAVSVVNLSARETRSLLAYTFLHELAHNMGAGHEVADRTGYCGFSKAWLKRPDDSGDVLMTVLSNASGAFVDLISNPDVEYVQGISVGRRGATDNARTLNLTRVSVEQWRPSKSTEPLDIDRCEAMTPVLTNR